MIDYDKYIFSSGLVGLRREGRKWNCKCPVCDDITLNKSNGRLWFLPNENWGYVARCWNGGCTLEKGISLQNFLGLIDKNLEEKLKAESRTLYLDGIIKDKTIRKKEVIEFIPEEHITFFVNKLSSKYFKPLTKEAIEYCKSRKIPKEIYRKWFYSDIANKRWDKHLIIPFYRNSDNTIYGFNARHLRLKKFTLKPIKKGNTTVYNIFNIDNTERVWIFESLIDSLTMKNSVAMNTATIDEKILKKIKYPVFVFDNDFTGIKQSLKYLEDGFKCVLLPSSMKYKDANQMLCNGLSNNDIERLFLSNIYEGLVGKMKAYKLIKERRF